MPNDLILLACSKKKLSHAAPARELYIGQLFRCALRYVDSTGRPALILSAKYGWITLDTVVEPYDVSIPYHKPYTGQFPKGSGHYIGGQNYFAFAPPRFAPLVPYYHNRGTLSWQAHIKNMMDGVARTALPNK